MRDINGPFLEFGFYPMFTGHEAFYRRLVMILLDLGARPISAFCAQQRDPCLHMSNKASDWLYDSLELNSVDAVKMLLEDHQHTVIRLYMELATDTTPDVAERVEYIGFPADSGDPLPATVEIQTCGQYFNSFDDEPLVGTRTYRRRSKLLGLRAYERFVSIVSKLNPAYATISVERPILSPDELRSNADEYLFHDFYVSGSFIGIRGITKVSDLYSGAYMQELNDGLYISTRGILNPDGVNCEVKTIYPKSKMMSRMLAYVETF